MAKSPADPPKRRYRSRASSMEALRSAALEALTTVGPEQVTIREIAERADVAHVYIPQYFGGKAELLADIYPTAAIEAAQAFSWPYVATAEIRPELLRLARLTLWLSANHPDGVPSGPRPLATRVTNAITQTFELDDRTANLVTERLIALVLVFASAPTAISPEPIDLAAHIHLEMRLLTALAAARDTDPSV
jgi:AcrR family transcriptional regulator